MRSSNLLDHFSVLEDPRQSWKTVYPLEEVLLIVLAGVMAGADDFVEISYWAERKLAFLRRFLPFKEGIPSHDTLQDLPPMRTTDYEETSVHVTSSSGFKRSWIRGTR